MDNSNQTISQSPSPIVPTEFISQQSPPPEKKMHMPLFLGFLSAGIVIMIILSIIFALGSSKTTPAKNTTYIPPTPTPTFIPTPQPFNLLIESPSDQQVVSENKITISGKTFPNTTLVLFSDDDQNSIESDENGNFSGEITLTSGINTIAVTAYHEDEEEKSQTFDVIYDDQSE